MSFKPAGIKEVYLAAGSAVFPVTPTVGTDVFGMGYKDSGILKITPFGEIKTKGNLVFPSLRNFQAVMKTMQLDYNLVKFLFGAAAASDVTAKIVTSGLSKATDFTASGGIFTFEDDQSLGIDFELNLTPKERVLTVTLEGALKEADAAALITAAKTDTLKGTLKVPALDEDALVMGYISPSFGTIMIADDRLSDWKINLKTRSTKNSFNKSIVSKIDVDIMGVMDGIDPDEMNTFQAGAIAPDLTLVVGVDTPYNIIMKSGGLTQMGEVELDDDKRIGTVHFTGSYDIEFLDYTGDDVTLQAQL